MCLLISITQKKYIHESTLKKNLKSNTSTYLRIQNQMSFLNLDVNTDRMKEAKVGDRRKKKKGGGENNFFPLKKHIILIILLIRLFYKVVFIDLFMLY